MKEKVKEIMSCHSGEPLHECKGPSEAHKEKQSPKGLIAWLK